MSRSIKRVNLATVARRQVVDRNGRPLGRIGVLSAAMDEGRLEYVTLFLDPSPTSGRRKVVIPWSQFAVADDGKRLVLDISRNVLESVAALERPEFPG